MTKTFPVMNEEKCAPFDESIIDPFLHASQVDQKTADLQSIDSHESSHDAICVWIEENSFLDALNQEGCQGESVLTLGSPSCLPNGTIVEHTLSSDCGLRKLDLDREISSNHKTSSDIYTSTIVNNDVGTYPNAAKNIHRELRPFLGPVTEPLPSERNMFGSHTRDLLSQTPVLEKPCRGSTAAAEDLGEGAADGDTYGVIPLQIPRANSNGGFRIKKFRPQRLTHLEPPPRWRACRQNNDKFYQDLNRIDDVIVSAPLPNDKPNHRNHPLYRSASIGNDGFYHCPWEGQVNCDHKPERLKCTYDKMVDSHLKPYRCRREGCDETRYSSHACLFRHEREAHGMHGYGDKPFLCPDQDCERSIPGNGFARRWNLRDHVRRIHGIDADGKPENATRKMRKDTDKVRKPRRESRTNKGEEKNGKQKLGTKNKIPSEHNLQSDPLSWDQHQKSLSNIAQELDTADGQKRAELLVAADCHLASLKLISSKENMQRG